MEQLVHCHRLDPAAAEIQQLLWAICLANAYLLRWHREADAALEVPDRNFAYFLIILYPSLAHSDGNFRQHETRTNYYCDE